MTVFAHLTQRRYLVSALLLMALTRIPGASAAEHFSLMTDFSIGAAHAPIYLAIEKGWFKDAGIDLDVADGKGSTSTINLVGAGRIDIGYVNVGPVMPAREAGMQVRAIAQFTRKTDLAVIYAADSGITNPAQLSGKNIICFSGSVWTPFIPEYLKHVGVAASAAPVTNVDVNAMYPTYILGKADGIYTSYAHGFPIVDARRPTKAFMAADAGITLPGYGLVVNDALIKRDPAALKKIVAVLDRSWQYMRNGHEQEALDALATERPDAKLNPKMAMQELKIWETMIDSPETVGKPIGWQSPVDWDKAMAVQQSAGLIKPGHHPDEFYTNALFNQ